MGSTRLPRSRRTHANLRIVGLGQRADRARSDGCAAGPQQAEDGAMNCSPARAARRRLQSLHGDRRSRRRGRVGQSIALSTRSLPCLDESSGQPDETTTAGMRGRAGLRWPSRRGHASGHDMQCAEAHGECAAGILRAESRHARCMGRGRRIRFVIEACARSAANGCGRDRVVRKSWAAQLRSVWAASRESR